MRTFRRSISAALLALTLTGGAAMTVDLGLAPKPALALDGASAPSAAPVPLPTPTEAFRSGARALRAGETEKAVTALEYAAEKGHATAQWKLGRMYAEGDGVPQDDLRAFQYFSRVASAHADDSPQTAQSRFVANAFVALGQYYLDGIPNTAIKPDASRAREMFAYAASYFGDADAQYSLARLYLNGKGAPHDARQAARWLGLAANKGQFQAQALLGQMLFKGSDVPRQAARGLMWLTLAREGARDTIAGDDKWIGDLYDSAVRQATRDEREMAFTYLESYMNGRRD